MILRSLLFAPGSHERHVSKALSGPADGAIIDLEDAVPPDLKDRAREMVAKSPEHAMPRRHFSAIGRGAEPRFSSGSMD